jgi:hypothetical protein
MRRADGLGVVQMILDGLLHGILDQGTGCLEVFEPEEKDET